MKNSCLNDAFFSRLETLALELRANLGGFFGGKHLVRTYGQTVEFADYREYMLGDDIRRIDWNLYSRFEKFFLKLFTDERQMHTQIFLDCSASMGKDMPQKSDYAVAIAAALGYLSVHNMDKVSFKLVKGDKAEDTNGTIVGKRAFFNAITTLDNIVFDGPADIYKAIISCPNMGSNDGLTVIISDFLNDSDWKKAVDFLRYKRKQVLLVQVLTPDEIDPTYDGRVKLVDVEADGLDDVRNLKMRINRANHIAYRQALADMQEDMRSFCASREADYITVNTENPLERMLFQELLKVGIMA
jgi:uncharacterized protein (DUF58 family)